MKLFLGILLLVGMNSLAHAAKANPCEVLKIKQTEIELISSNIANIETTRTPDGGPYQRKVLKCKSTQCKVVSVNKTIKRYMPEHPDADVNGYVLFPKIDLKSEVNSMLAASAAYDKARVKCE